MPLLDHFHGQTELELPWPTMSMAWALALVHWLDRTLPRDKFQALANMRQGAEVEADISEYRLDEPPGAATGSNGAVATLTSTPPAVLTVAAVFPDELQVQIRARRSGRPVVGVIELVSPANEDRPKAREAFVARCAAFLQQGIGVVVIDVVTERHANLHNELMRFLGPPDTPPLVAAPTYVAGYRPVYRPDTHADEIEAWPYPAPVGEPIPVVPFALRGGPTVMLDLETTYTAAVEPFGL